MTVNTTNFILQLCVENKIQPFYEKKLVNKLSGKEIVIEYSSSIESSHAVIEMVTDIPDYLNVILSKINNQIEIKRITQYDGYLINLAKFHDIEDLVNKTFSRNPRKNLRSKIRKLEETYDVNYVFYYGNIKKTEYDHLFDVCYISMKERFEQKKIHNRYLLEWHIYYDLFYPKILKKEASICVIYDKEKPITITLNFHRSGIVFSFIQIYDVDYFKYSMGDIAMLKNLEWSFQNNFEIWDVSKGATDNKLRWSNHIYKFHHHLFYKRNSFTSSLIAFIVSKMLIFKQTLRKRGIIGNLIQLDKLYYYSNRKKIKGHNWKSH